MQAPKQNWKLFEELCSAEHTAWLRSLTPEQSVSLCEELRCLALQMKGIGPAEESLSQCRWEEKLAIRNKLRRAFLALDRIGRE